MIPEKIRILMNSEIDGLTTPAEKEELARYFAAHPEQREAFDQLRASLRVLDRLDQVDPPADLHDRIMTAVAGARPRPAVDRKARPAARSEGPGWREVAFGKLRLGYAFSAAAGVMLGFLLHALIPVDGMGRDLTALELFRGTATSELVRDGWTEAAPQTWDREGFTGQVHAFRQGGQILVRLSLRAEEQARLGLRFGPGARLQGIHFQDNEGIRTATGPAEVQFDGAGVCRCEFLVDAAGGDGVDLQLQGRPDGAPAETRRISWR